MAAGSITPSGSTIPQSAIDTAIAMQEIGISFSIDRASHLFIFNANALPEAPTRSFSVSPENPRMHRIEAIAVRAILSSEGDVEELSDSKEMQLTRNNYGEVVFIESDEKAGAVFIAEPAYFDTAKTDAEVKAQFYPLAGPMKEYVGVTTAIIMKRDIPSDVSVLVRTHKPLTKETLALEAFAPVRTFLAEVLVQKGRFPFEDTHFLAEEMPNLMSVCAKATNMRGASIVEQLEKLA